MKKIFFFLLGIFIPNFMSSQIKEGVYYGIFPGSSTPIFYEVEEGNIEPIGSPMYFDKIKIHNDDFFEISLFEEKIICEKIDIEKKDYSQKTLDENSEFNGLHYGPLSYDKEYNGFCIGIKNLKNDDILITFFKFEDFFLYKTTGKISTVENKEKKYKKLKFNINKEEWAITYNWVTDYEYNYFFDVYINGKYRFQIEVIDNGIK